MELRLGSTGRRKAEPRTSKKHVDSDFATICPVIPLLIKTIIRYVPWSNSKMNGKNGFQETFHATGVSGMRK